MDKKSAEEKLEVAAPALLEAEAALQTIKPAHVASVRKLQKPPHLIMRIMDCALILFRKRLDTVTIDPEKNCVKTSWAESLRLMSAGGFLQSLMTFPKVCIYKNHIWYKCLPFVIDCTAVFVSTLYWRSAFTIHGVLQIKLFENYCHFPCAKNINLNKSIDRINLLIKRNVLIFKAEKSGIRSRLQKNLFPYFSHFYNYELSYKLSYFIIIFIFFITTIINHQKDTINEEMCELLEPYFAAEDYNLETAKKASGDVAGLLSWTKAMSYFFSINKEVSVGIQSMLGLRLHLILQKGITFSTQQ